MTKKFAALAGLPDAPVIVIPTAEVPNHMSEKDAEREKDVMARFFGAKNVIVLHAKDRKQADSEAFVQPLRQANAVWIEGGKTATLARYVGTRTESELRALYARGGVVGGTSAGALILGSFKMRLPQSLRPNGGRPGQDEIGLGLVRDTVILPHFSQWHRTEQMSKVVAAHPTLLGLGIDEDTGVVVHEGVLEVLGPKSARIFLAGAKGEVTLGPGEKYDLQARARR